MTRLGIFLMYPKAARNPLVGHQEPVRPPACPLPQLRAWGLGFRAWGLGFRFERFGV